ncbi:MAG: hypothetical protein HYZ75_13655 [Elusimicrobia bacterium]|nr:hypothetical protein [Elusimicrobiota bacterium]
MPAARNRHGARGAALVEVIISGLLIAIAVSSVMGALLHARRGAGKTGSLERASLHAERLRTELKNYVTDDHSPLEGAPGTPPGSWKLEGDPCDCWALREGAHDASALLPEDFRTRHGATMTYVVSVTVVDGSPLRQADIKVRWEDADR